MVTAAEGPETLNSGPRQPFQRHALLLVHLRESILDIIVAGRADGPKAPDMTHSSVAIPGTLAETVLHQFEAKGITCGLSSACLAQGQTASPVLLAIDFNLEYRNSVLPSSFYETEPATNLQSIEALSSV